MSAQLVIQYVVVALIVLASVWVAMRKLLPKPTTRWLAAASIHFGRKRDSRVAQSLSRHLQPKQATSHSCADGCATCNACGPTKPAAARPSPMPGHDPVTRLDAQMRQAIPLHFRDTPATEPVKVAHGHANTRG